MSAVRFCEVCKELIDPERAEAIPDTQLCSKHAQEILKFGGEFLLITSLERTSKHGGLKHNYGSVNVERERNLEAMENLKREYDLRE